MQGLNRVTLMGNIGARPELRFTDSGEPVLNLSVATNKQWIDRDTKQLRESVAWHRVSFWGKRAKGLAPHLHKGDPIFLEGEIRYQKYTDREGVERYSTEIRANNMRFLANGKKPSNAPQAADHDPDTGEVFEPASSIGDGSEFGAVEMGDGEDLPF